MINYVHTLLTYGVSPAGAEQSAWGQPVTNPADQLVLDKAKGTLGRSAASVSDAAMMKARLAQHDTQSMLLSSAKQRAAAKACAELYAEIYKNFLEANIHRSTITSNQGMLGLVKRWPRKPSDSDYESYRRRCSELETNIREAKIALYGLENRTNQLRIRYNKDCGGDLAIVQIPQGYWG